MDLFYSEDMYNSHWVLKIGQIINWYYKRWRYSKKYYYIPTTCNGKNIIHLWSTVCYGSLMKKIILTSITLINIH